MNTKRFLLSALVGLVLIAAWVAAVSWAFRAWLNLDYGRWYLAIGGWINLAFALVAQAWGDLNLVKDLVSAHPFLYASACFYLLSLPIEVFGGIFKPQHPMTPRTETRSALARWTTLWRAAQGVMDLFDTLVTRVFVIALTLALLAWLVVVAPLQYFVYLICAAPARLMRRSQRRIVYSFDEARYFHVYEIDRDEKIEDGYQVATLYPKPVSLTAAFAAILLAILAQVIR